MNPLTRDQGTLMQWYELGWPAKLDAKRVLAALHALGGALESKGMRFAIKATATDIRHYLAVPDDSAPSIMQLLRTFLPEVEIHACEPVHVAPLATVAVRTTTKTRVLDTRQPERTSYGLLGVLSNLARGETVLLTTLLGGSFSPVAVPRGAAGFEADSPLGRMAEAVFRKPKSVDAQGHASMQEKYAAHTWKAACFIGVETHGVKRAYQLVNRIVGAYRSAEAPGVRIVARPTFASRLHEEYMPFFWRLRLNPDELIGLLAWPLGEQVVPGIARIASKRLPVPAGMPRSTRVIAATNTPGSNKPLSLNAQDGLMHTHVIGPTGVGKSTLLLNLITQDIATNRGVVVIDPKGDLVHDVLCRVPAKRTQDVIVLDPSDTIRPVGLNPLARHNQPAALVADNILSVFHGLYGNYFGPRTQDILHAGLLTLCSAPGMSLCTLPILYTNATFRARLVSKLDDPLGLGSFWSWFDTVSDAERNTALAPVMNKLRTFLLRPSMRLVMGQGHPKFDFGEVLNGDKLVLVNLAKGTLGSETAQLFGSLVVSQVWQAIQGRIALAPKQRRPVFVYVDEIQDYLHLPTDIGEVLAQARGYGVGMVLAHQYLAQLPPALRSGVLSNARSRICFQLSHEDAGVISRSNTVLTPEDFESLGRHEVYAQLVGNGEVLPWSSGVTLPPGDALHNGQAMREQSRQRYGRDAAAIEAELTSQITDTAKPQQRPIGRKRRAGGTV